LAILRAGIRLWKSLLLLLKGKIEWLTMGESSMSAAGSSYWMTFSGMAGQVSEITEMSFK
jgi:hypothetical protein